MILAIALSATRMPWCDEVLFSSPGLNMVTRGNMGMSNLETAGTNFPGLDRYAYTAPPLYFFAQAAWFKAVGFGLVRMRLPTLFWAVLALAGIFGMVRILVSTEMALLAASILALDYTFVLHVASGRPDMMSAALGFLGLFGYLYYRESGLPKAVLLSHSLIAASGLTHPVGGLLALCSLLFLTFWLDRGRLRWSMALFAAIPYVIGSVGWGMYIMLDPNEFVQQFHASVNSFDRLSGFRSPWGALLREIQGRYLDYYGFKPEATVPIIFKRALLPGYVIGAILAYSIPAVRRHPGKRILLMLAALNILGLAVLDGSKEPVYLTYVIPYYICLLASVADTLWSAYPRARWALAATVTALVLIQVVPVVYRIRVNTNKSIYAPTIDFVRRNAPTEGVIMGPVELGPGLDFSTSLVEDSTLGYYSGKRPGLIITTPRLLTHWDHFAKKRPDVSRHVQAIMSRFHMGLTNPEFTVYLRN